MVGSLAINDVLHSIFSAALGGTYSLVSAHCVEGAGVAFQFFNIPSRTGSSSSAT